MSDEEEITEDEMIDPGEEVDFASDAFDLADDSLIDEVDELESTSLEID